MTAGLYHQCGELLRDQPRIRRDAAGRYLEAWCPRCETGQAVRHVRRRWGVETVTREIERPGQAVPA